MTSPEDHKLQNNNNYNNDVNQANGNHNNFNNANTKDGSNDYFVATGEWNNGFCFDLSQYSLSYYRCASKLDNQLATQEDSEGVFATKFCGVLLSPREDLHGDLGPGVRQ